MIGTTVGKYRILGRLGRGGMGIVYKAVDETLDREVAIKVLNPDVSDVELLKRFRAEAVSLARLNHPGIATIYELHRHGDELLMVMEFVRGATLQALSEQLGPLDPSQAAHVAVQILEALAHAHRAGIVHRDLKPANVMVTDSGSVKIMDFGIARVLGGEHFTHAGITMGTPAYMAPEQVLGRDIDGRADLYSVGVIFYRLLSRELPFKADTAIAMAQKQVADAPTPLGTFRPHLPPWCETIISTALSKAPDDRFQTAEAFRNAILMAVIPEPLGELPTMATPIAGILQGSEVTSSHAGTPSSLPPATASESASLAATAPPRASTATGSTPRTGGSSLVERTGTTVVLGRGHLIALAALLLVLIGGIAALGFFALTRGGPTVQTADTLPADAAPATAESEESPAAQEDPAEVPAEADVTALQAEAPPAEPPSTPPAAPPAAQAPTPRPVAKAVAPPAKNPKSEEEKTAPPEIQEAPAPPPPVEPPAPARPTVAPIAFKDVKMLVTQGDTMRDRDAILTLEGERLAVLERDGQTEILSLPYASIVQAFFSRSRHPRWTGADGKEVQISVDLGRMSVFRGERNWLILTTHGNPVIVRFENAELQAALAAVQQRSGVRVQRQAPGRQ